MTVIKINAITVPDGSGDELAQRFAARAGAVDGQDGFEGFELLRPTDGRNQWLVVTRWRDEAAFQGWATSPAFAHGHAGADRPAPHGGPVAIGSELWSYEVAGGSAGEANPYAGAVLTAPSSGLRTEPAGGVIGQLAGASPTLQRPSGWRRRPLGMR